MHRGHDTHGGSRVGHERHVSTRHEGGEAS
jgi:hypothetical protein